MQAALTLAMFALNFYYRLGIILGGSRVSLLSAHIWNIEGKSSSQMLLFLPDVANCCSNSENNYKFSFTEKIFPQNVPLDT